VETPNIFKEVAMSKQHVTAMLGYDPLETIGSEPISPDEHWMNRMDVYIDVYTGAWYSQADVWLYELTGEAFPVDEFDGYTLEPGVPLSVETQVGTLVLEYGESEGNMFNEVREMNEPKLFNPEV
jgi:hypothetical protein